MTQIQFDAGTLMASDDDNLDLTYALIPHGERCRSNLGEFAVDTGVFTIPEDLTGMAVNLDHRREEPVAAFVHLVDQAETMLATFRFAKTPTGRAAYADAKDPAGRRRHVSVEASGVIIKAGKAIAGHVFGAALVEKPAFPSATLLAAAADTEPVETSEHSEDEYTDESGNQWRRVRDVITTAETSTDGDTQTTSRTTVIEESTTSDTNTESETLVATATVPNTAAAAATSTNLTLQDVSGMLYACRQGLITQDDMREQLSGQNGANLFAALNDVAYDGAGGLANTMAILPQWMGLVWAALNYRQQVLPLFTHKPLTSLTLSGYKWTTKPSGGTWAGNKAAVPSNTLVVAPVTGTALRYAVGHDIAREFLDFEIPGFFESYAAAVTEDYAKWADTQVTTAVIAAATALAGDALATLPGVAGGTIGSGASALLDGAAALVTKGVLPTFALMGVPLWKQMIKTPKSNVLGYLNAALGLSEGDLAGFIIRPSAAVANTKVLVGAKEAVTVYELPGVPIRIDALDLAKGGIDKAAFGYCATVINDAQGLQLVTVGA